MTPTLQTSALATAYLWLCCYPRTEMPLPPCASPLICLCVSAVLRARQTGLSSFWKKKKVSYPGQRCGELVLRTDSLTNLLTGKCGRSTTRPGACPSTAGQSLCAYHPKEDSKVNERKTRKNGHKEGRGGEMWEVQGRSDTLIKLSVKY